MLIVIGGSGASADSAHSGDAIIARVEAELARQLHTLPTAATARAAVERNGFAVAARDLDEAVALANHIASEHLELLLQVHLEWALSVMHEFE